MDDRARFHNYTTVLMEKQRHRPKNYEESSWLQDKIRLTQWDIEQPYESHDLGPIHSLLVDNDSRFIQLKSIIDQYNTQVEAALSTKQGIVHGGVKWRYIDTLYAMLRELTQMKNQELQKKYLNEVYDWANNYEFTKKSRPITAATTRATTGYTLTRPTSGVTYMSNARRKKGFSYGFDINGMNDELQGKGDFEVLVTEDKKKKSLSTFQTKQMTEISNQRKDYARKHRTIHPLHDVAPERLKEYKRKRLDIQMQNPVPRVAREPNKVIKIPAEKMSSEQEFFGEDIDFGQPREEQPLPIQEESLVEPQVEDIPDADFGGDPDEEAQLQEPEEEEVLDKLGPKVRIYRDQNIDINGDTEQAINNRGHRVKHNQLKEVIADKSVVQIVQGDWARVKARMQKEQSRRREAVKGVARTAVITQRENLGNNVINLAGVYQRPLTAFKPSAISGIQVKLSEFKIKNVLDSEMKNIRLGQMGDFGNMVQAGDQTSKPRCLSANVRPTHKRVEFSQILERGRQKIMSQLDSELIDLKERLAGDRVPLNILKLKQGISIGQVDMKKIYQNSQFPLINGKQLLHNPFFKVAKKKKKKKKKK